MPDGSGILHKLAREPDTKFEHINQMAHDLFQVSKKKVEAYLERVDGPVTFEIPILPDINDQTPLDICLDVKKDDQKGKGKKKRLDNSSADQPPELFHESMSQSMSRRSTLTHLLSNITDTDAEKQ